MVKTLREALCRLFNLYPEEGNNAFLFAFLGFLWAIGVTTALKFADALFLVHVGAHALPTAYTVTACGMLGVASLLLYAFHYMSSYRIYLCVLLVGFLFYLTAFICHTVEIVADVPWFWYALKIFGFFLFSVATTCFWTFIDQYHSMQDAKRLYTLFSATIFIGVAATGLIMRLGFLSLGQLFLLIMGLLLMTAYWVSKINRSVTLVVHEDTETELSPSDPHNSLLYLLKSILSSRFTLLLMTGNMLMQLLLVFTEYNYLSAFERYFEAHTAASAAANEGTTAALTLFLGKCLAWVSVSNLIIGLFIYSRLVRRFGVTNLIFITPVLLIIAFSGWSLSDMLLFPLIGFFVAEGTLYVIDDNNFNLLLNAVPSKLKYKIRVMIESFFEPIGMLISASLLAWLAERSRYLGIALACCLLAVAIALHSQYLKALFRNLAENAVHFHRTIRNWISSLTSKQQKAAEIRLLAILKVDDEPIQLFACEGLLAFGDPTILNKLLTLASEMERGAKVKFIQLLEQSVFAKDKLVLDFLQTWIQQDSDPHLKGAITLYLARQGLLIPDNVVADLTSEDLFLQGAAIATLLASSNPTWCAMAHDRLNKQLGSFHDDEVVMGIRVLGMGQVNDRVQRLLPYLKHHSLPIARAAATALSHAVTPRDTACAPTLIAQLALSSDNDLRLATLQALGKINDPTLVRPIIGASIHFRPNERRLTETIISHMGLQAVDQLLALVQDIGMHDRCRLLAGRILGMVSLPQLRAHLTPILHHEIERAYFYFYHSHTIQEEHPDLDLDILKDTLWTGYLSIIDFTIQLLGVAGEVEDCELLSRCLRSRNPKMRSQVVEALEKTCETPLFRLIQPLVADMPHQEKILAYGKGKRTPLSLTDLLDKISQSPAQVDQIVAATLKYRLGLPNWREDLRKQMASHDEIFHHFAYELLQS